jgi:rSAM/selenodomain-associated transferase 1
VYIFTKPAVAGRAKTRLIGDLSASQAAQLHEAFLGDMVERLDGQLDGGAGTFELRLAWALAAGEEAPEIAGLERQPPAVRQPDGDLGERLLVVLAEACRHYPFALAVGSDHPELSREIIEAACRRLAEGAPVVLGPAADGGYYLIGVTARTAVPELFRGIPWSTDAVLSITQKRCRRLGIDPVLLPGGEDVDTPADLHRLTRRLEEGEVHCPRTRRLLASWGRIAALEDAP